MKKIAFAFAGLLALNACQTTQEAENLVILDADFSWKDTSRCSSTPPAFKISNLPEGTKFVKFQMTDLDVPQFMHGGGIVAHAGGNDIPAGSFTYKGPCPPSGSHRYEFKIEALNGEKDTVLGRGKIMKPFPPKS